MARRHRKPARLSPRARRSLLGLAMVAVLGTVASVALGAAIDDVRACQETVPLRVGAAPEIAPVLIEHAATWSETAPPVEGTCITVEVTAVDSPSVATALATAVGSELDVGDTSIAETRVPDVWVPESLTWLARLDDATSAQLGDRIDSVAEGSVGIAMPETALSDEMPSLRTSSLQLEDPHHDAASLAVLISATGEMPFKPDRSADGYRPMSQAAVSLYNFEHPDEPLMFVESQQPAPPFDYPYITRADLDDAAARACDAFRSSLLTTNFTMLLGDYGLRPAGPYPQVPDPQTIEEALAAW